MEYISVFYKSYYSSYFVSSKWNSSCDNISYVRVSLVQICSIIHLTATFDRTEHGSVSKAM